MYLYICIHGDDMGLEMYFRRTKKEKINGFNEFVFRIYEVMKIILLILLSSIVYLLIYKILEEF